MQITQRIGRFWGLMLLLALPGCGYNSIQAADEDVKAGWADVQNQFQRRMDLIPNLVKTVKGAAAFERETLQGVIEARSASILDNPEAFARFQQVQNQLGSALQRLLVVVERYPDIKTTAAFSACSWWSSAIPISRPPRPSVICRRSSKEPRTVSRSPAAATSRTSRRTTSWSASSRRT
jgi:hypothetical protein